MKTLLESILTEVRETRASIDSLVQIEMARESRRQSEEQSLTASCRLIIPPLQGAVEQGQFCDVPPAQPSERIISPRAIELHYNAYMENLSNLFRLRSEFEDLTEMITKYSPQHARFARIISAKMTNILMQFKNAEICFK